MKKTNRKEFEDQQKKIEDEIIKYQKRTGHKKPSSRREFLGAGLIQFTGLMFAPSMLDLILRATPAYAAECPAVTAATQKIPFITVNLSGGWGSQANWLPRDIGGQLLKSYVKSGFPTLPTTVNAFANNALFTSQSDTAGFLSGVKSKASATTIGKAAFLGIPVQSQDDTDNTNKFDANGLLAKASLTGSKLANVGTKGTTTGVGQLPAFNIAPPKPLVVNKFADLTAALGFTGTLNSLTQAQQISLTKTVKNLSASQAAKLASMSGGANLMDIVGCSTQRNIDNVTQGTAGFDPAGRTGMSTIWNLANTGEQARAAMVMNSLTGLVGSVAIDLGGYDYHGNARTDTDAKDQSAGVLIGQILETATLVNSKVMIYVTSDGCVSADASGDWQGDAGDRGNAYLIAYDPAKAPSATTSQLGGFTASEAVDTKFVGGTGNSPELVAATAFINWASLNKNMALIQQVLPNLTAAQIANLLVFS